MENKTKIVLLQAKELIFIFMFGNNKDKKDQAKALYHPGTYTSSVALGDSSFDVCVTVSETAIKDVTFNQLNDSVTTMYPLLNKAMDSVKEEVKKNGSIEKIAFQTDYQYTGTVIQQAIESALDKAAK